MPDTDQPARPRMTRPCRTCATPTPLIRLTDHGHCWTCSPPPPADDEPDEVPCGHCEIPVPREWGWCSQTCFDLDRG